jgi:biopolymer transport protein ExbD
LAFVANAPGEMNFRSRTAPQHPGIQLAPLVDVLNACSEAGVTNVAFATAK